MLIRATIDEVETDVVEIEAKLDKLVKLCSGMIEAGKAYITTNKHFVSGVRDLSQQCKKDEMISECLDKFGDSLQEMINYHMILFDQAQRSVRQQLHNFVKDLQRDRPCFVDLLHLSHLAELIFIVFDFVNRPEISIDKIEGLITHTGCGKERSRRLGTYLNYFINVLQAKKKFEILDAMLSFMHAQYTFFQQGYSLLHELDPYMKKLATELPNLVIGEWLGHRAWWVLD
ncbi:arf-gap with coiled- ank repeat and ph domain-containing protein 3 [Limosa lapponica baueri]|uniref:Arf-GAP with coiled-coil, ANK repeat and PH domain-containing protein n=1 Tax=Limosa lapponica baueri TaxID=1758121 RepID=A0A2I0TL69_LIMLA|nr:arf-gap with coiled- ank repeat and ph domain-containing protein 3 [Limosa lapponica baueri]